MQCDKDAFLSQASQVHNGKYDYSKMQYVDQNTLIVITCPLHGDFEKKPCNHLKGAGCPKCSKIEAEKKRQQTMLQRYGATTFAGSKQAQDLRDAGKGPWVRAAREKAANTCVERFGAKTWAESEVGVETARRNCSDPAVRKQMSERAKSQVTRQHYAETSQKNHGASHWTQTEHGRRKLHEMFSTDEERKARSERMLSDEVQGKIRATSMERYGTPYYWQSDEGRVRLKELLSRVEVQQKIAATKKSRGTSNSSKAEKLAYSMLVDKFGADDVEVQYNLDERYPFACDFYIKSRDLFVELNASWLHGFHWFDDANPDDLERLQVLVEKSEQGKPMYSRAIYIWTYDDLRKRHIAEANGLNYLVFWDNDLTDFKKWLETI